MVSRGVAASILLSLIALLAGLGSSAVDYPTTCYVLDGTHNLAAGFRCDNSTTGHSACCAAGGICYSNGVCQQSNDDVQDYLRVGCTDQTWKDPACLDQCTIYANDSTAGIRFCNGAITSTDEYCCDDGSNGIGSFACCNTASDIFAINPPATVLAQVPLTYTSSSASTTSTSSSATSTSSSSAATTTPTSSATTTPASSGGSSTNGAAIGAGVGVPLGLIALAGIGYLFWRHRRNAKRQHVFKLQNGHEGGYAGAGAGAGAYHDNNSPNPQEAPGSIPMEHQGKKGYFSGRQYEPAPQEMPLTQPHMVHEMGTGNER